MASSTYPRPAHPPSRRRVAPVTPFHPPGPLPDAQPPSLPRRPPSPRIEGYTATQHVLPCAWPRQFRACTGNLRRESRPFSDPERPGDVDVPESRSGSGSEGKGESKEERARRNLREASNALRAAMQAREAGPQWNAEAGAGTGTGLWIAAERLVRDGADAGRVGDADERVGDADERVGDADERVGDADERVGDADERVGDADERVGDADGHREEGLTLVCCHANGFFKESWYPTLRRLLSKGPIDRTVTFGAPSSSARAPSSPLPTASAASSSPSTSPLPASSPPTPSLPSSLPRGSSHPTWQIDEIWLLDDAYQGASVDLNAGLLGAVKSWTDGARDLVQFLTSLHNQSPPSSSTPVPPGSRSSSDPSPPRPRRRVIGIGHSLGGNALVQAAHARPDLFTALVLVEPICAPLCALARGNHVDRPEERGLVLGALRRRDTWPTRDEAVRSVLMSPFFRAWHTESIELWKSHGLVPVPVPSALRQERPAAESLRLAGAEQVHLQEQIRSQEQPQERQELQELQSQQQLQEQIQPEVEVEEQPHPQTQGEVAEPHVQLATPKWCEAATFAEPSALGEAWDQLPHLRVPTGFVVAGDAAMLGGPAVAAEMVHRVPGARHERIIEAGHLVVQERPDELADAIWRFLGSLRSDSHSHSHSHSHSSAASSQRQAAEGTHKARL